jgi:hypothetical protein
MGFLQASFQSDVGVFGQMLAHNFSRVVGRPESVKNFVYIKLGDLETGMLTVTMRCMLKSTECLNLYLLYSGFNPLSFFGLCMRCSLLFG